jgi:hypothetical protein
VARGTVNRTNPASGSAHVVFTDASGANREGVVLAGDGVDAPVATPQLASGELVLAIAGGVYASTSGTITAPTSVVTSGDISRAGNVTIGIFGTYAGVNAAFEVSPDAGTTWFAVGCTREDSAINETTTGVLAANTVRMWTTGAPGFNRIRVRATAWTSGTATVVLLPGAMPFEPLTAAVVNPLVATPTRVNVATSAASVTLRAANTARKGLMISNAATSTLYVDLTGGTATTTTANSFPLPVGSTWVMDPTTFTTGLVTGIWAATGGNGANVTEFT